LRTTALDWQPENVCFYTSDLTINIMTERKTLTDFASLNLYFPVYHYKSVLKPYVKCYINKVYLTILCTNHTSPENKSSKRDQNGRTLPVQLNQRTATTKNIQIQH